MKKSRPEIFVLALLFLCLGAVFGVSQKASEVILAQGTRISVELNDHLGTKLSIEGDSFTANVTAPVYQGERLIIPKGSFVIGSVSRVQRPGRFRGKAVMNVIFESLQIPGKSQVALVASIAQIDPEGNSGIKEEGAIVGEGSKGKDAGRVAKPALVGTGIGALVGGGKGAAIGAGVGAVAGLAGVFATRGKDVELNRGMTLEIVLDRPLVIPVEAEASVVKN
jgi:hypothetical protein